DAMLVPRHPAIDMLQQIVQLWVLRKWARRVTLTLGNQCPITVVIGLEKLLYLANVLAELSRVVENSRAMCPLGSQVVDRRTRLRDRRLIEGIPLSESVVSPGNP